MKKNTPLSERIKGYSLLATTMLASGTMAEAQIAYTDVNPDFIGFSFDFFDVDLNNDGISDFTIWGLYYYGAATTVNWVVAICEPGNSIANSSGYPAALDYGVTINSGLQWNNGLFQSLGFYSYDNFDQTYVSGGNWVGVNEKYLGVRFAFNGETHYGWIRLSLYDEADGFILHDYAYEKQPDSPIVAGAVDDLVCQTPFNLSVNKKSAISAILSWSPVTSAIVYRISYRESGSSSWSSILSESNTKRITGLTAGMQYDWTVTAICNKSPLIQSDRSETATFTTDPLRSTDESSQQLSFQIHPNPSQDQTTIHFTLAQSSHVSVKVYDVSGKELETLINDELEEGDHSLLFNTAHFAKGVYLVRMVIDGATIETASYEENQKLIVH